MGSYFDEAFLPHICREDVKVIFELGSRDLEDARKLRTYYGADVYSFECNPDCLALCRNNFATFSEEEQLYCHLVEKAVCETNGPVVFYPFESSNIGASSLLQIDLSERSPNDPLFGAKNLQSTTTVDGIRLDTFMEQEGLSHVDLVCMDLQGYELPALRSLGRYLESVKYIITEASVKSTYKGVTLFFEMEAYLSEFGFEYVSSTIFGENRPNRDIKQFLEFDVLFKKA